MGRGTANAIQMANSNRMDNVPVNNRRKKDNSRVSSAEVDNHRKNDNRMNRNPVSVRRADNNRASNSPDNNPVNDNPVSNRASDNLDNSRMDNSRVNRKAISLATGNNRDSSLNLVNVNRDKLKGDNLSPDNNLVNEDSRASSLKRVSVSRDNRSRVNGDSEVLRDWLTTINPVGLSNQRVARIASSRRSAAKIFSTGPTACAMSRRWWTIPNCERKPLAFAIKPARSERS